MQNARMSAKPIHLHFNSRFPFPVNPIFFGQTFVIGNLTAATRFNGRGKNIVFIRDLAPLEEGLTSKQVHKLSEKRFNAELKFGYGIEAIDDNIRFIRSLIDKGLYPVLSFHYAMSSDTIFACALKDRLKQLGLDDHVAMIFYLHTRADGIVHKAASESFRRYYDHMVQAADGTISVSDSVLDSFMQTGNGQFDRSSAFVVRNGIDPYIYVIDAESEVTKARAEIGLAPDLEKVVSYAGRLDKIKGSSFLARVLEHFDRSKDPKDSKVGFVIATPHVLNIDSASRHFKWVMRMERLIRENRLKIVLDISKFTRSDPRFRGHVHDILVDYARLRGYSEIEHHQAYGGMTNKPVQTFSDIYLHPSRSEGLPLAVVEAVLSGAYVIATPVGGIPEVVIDKTLGTLVEIGTDINAFVNKLIMEICGRDVQRTYDRAHLADHLASYTEGHMFTEFSKAVSQIIERKR